VNYVPFQVCDRDMSASEREKIIHGIYSYRLPWGFCVERYRQRGIGTLYFLAMLIFILNEWSKFKCDRVAL